MSRDWRESEGVPQIKILSPFLAGRGQGDGRPDPSGFSTLLDSSPAAGGLEMTHRYGSATDSSYFLTIDNHERGQ